MVVNFGTNVVVSAKIYNMPKGQKEDYGKEQQKTVFCAKVRIMLDLSEVSWYTMRENR